MVSQCGKELVRSVTFGNRTLWVDAEGEYYTEGGVNLVEHLQATVLKKGKTAKKSVVSDIDEDYYCHCLTCNRVVLLGKCWEDRVSQADIDRRDNPEGLDKYGRT